MILRKQHHLLSVEAKEAMTTFSMVDTENTAGFDIRPVRVHVSIPSVLKVDVSEDVSTEAESLDKDVYINYPGMINAALKKPTKLSSVWDDHFSSKAVDGSHGTADLSHMACAISDDAWTRSTAIFRSRFRKM